MSLSNHLDLSFRAQRSGERNLAFSSPSHPLHVFSHSPLLPAHSFLSPHSWRACPELAEESGIKAAQRPFTPPNKPRLRSSEITRRHLRARLDALYFHLYGLTRDAAAYILSTFPIIQRHDEAEFGHYRTRALILAYMNALAAGDTESQMAV